MGSISPFCPYSSRCPFTNLRGETVKSFRFKQYLLTRERNVYSFTYHTLPGLPPPPESSQILAASKVDSCNKCTLTQRMQSRFGGSSVSVATMPIATNLNISSVIHTVQRKSQICLHRDVGWNKHVLIAWGYGAPQIQWLLAPTLTPH